TEPPAQTGAGGGRGEAANRGGRGNAGGLPEVVLNSIDVGLARVDQDFADWKTISVRVPNTPDAALSFNVDRGSTGQPQHRSTITFDRKTGEVAKIETFADQNLGRRTRSWLRYVHTGEYYGVLGQAVAGIASFAGVMLVWTGFALSLQRLGAWIRRRRRQTQPATLPTPAAEGFDCRRGL
ncbi:MAG TPA: PepSY-associated TM helix domain-containing protein, partial [Terriglobia bacterium]|nr:PepSY-associated TM helix domain-containing protein [Terriglobia bacterium]